MSRIIFITGGVRSGKSSLAVSLARKMSGKNGKVIFFAPAVAGDAEMRARIRAHRRSRPSSWLTVEEPLRMSKKINRFCAERLPFFQIVLPDVFPFAQHLHQLIVAFVKSQVSLKSSQPVQFQQMIHPP